MPKKTDIALKRSAVAALGSLGHPPSLQVGALCFRHAPNGLRILLITSRDTGRWVVPKGWPMRNRTEAEAAAREAFEEAGVEGYIGHRSLGLYGYQKGRREGRALHCVVRLYPLEVREMRKTYPETGQRRVKWFSPEKAARKVREPELVALIRAFATDQAFARSSERR